MIIKRAHADIPHKPLPDGQPATIQRYLSRFETAVPNLQEISVIHLLDKGSIDGQGQEGSETNLFILSGVGILHHKTKTYPYEPRDFFALDPDPEPFRIENTSDSPVSFLLIRMKIGAHDRHE